MRTPATASRVGALLAVAVAAACIDNTAPGNDREAYLDTPAPPAEVASAEGALSGVAVGLIQPEIMTDADLTNVPSVASACRFRFTEVGFPVLIYGTSAVAKLNGKLVALPAAGENRWAEGGVKVAIRPLEEPTTGEQFEAEFVLRLPDAPNELGFHGYSECD